MNHISIEYVKAVQRERLAEAARYRLLREVWDNRTSRYPLHLWIQRILRRRVGRVTPQQLRGTPDISSTLATATPRRPPADQPVVIFDLDGVVRHWDPTIIAAAELSTVSHPAR